MLSILKTKSTKTIIFLLFCILTLFCLSTIAYSAFSSTMNISGIAHSRVESDVRITDFQINDATNNVSSQYEDFSKNTIFSNITLPTLSSTITYLIEITNYGSNTVALTNITGLPENLNYTLTDYKLNDTICDESNKCTNYAVKTFYLTISYKEYNSESTNYNINLNFEFQSLLNITYVNNDSNYPKEILSGETLTIDFSKDEISPTEVKVSGNTTEVISYQNKILTIENVTNDLEITLMYYIKEYKYNYTGNYQTFTTPYDAMYKVELWGASGGTAGTIASDSIGHGAYTSGVIYLDEGINLHTYVGAIGNYDSSAFNGGGSGEAVGGGATDVRLVDGSWNNFDSLKSRIMVASGGGGGVLGYWDGTIPYTCLSVGHGGGLVGYDANCDVYNFGYGYSGYGASQTAGGESGKASSFSPFVGTEKGKFGIGGYKHSYSSGGGSGYYGGGHGVHPGSAWTGGGGGSSFISGHNGCDAISVSSTESNITHTGQSTHYSGYKFIHTQMIDGAGYLWTTAKGSQTGMPSYDGTSTMTGNSGNGYAKITMIFNKLTKFSVTYEGTSGEYPTTIVAGRDLTINFSDDIPEEIYVYINNNLTNDYTYQNGVLTIPMVIGDVKITTVYSKYEDNLLSYYPFKSDISDIAPKKYYGDFVTQSSTTLSHSDNGVLINSVGLKTKSNEHILPEQFTIIIDFKPISLDNNYHHIWGIWQGINTATNYNSLSYKSTQLQIQNGTLATKLTSTFSRKVGYIYIGENISQSNLDGEPVINGYLKNLRIYDAILSEDDIEKLSN